MHRKENCEEIDVVHVVSAEAKFVMKTKGAAPQKTGLGLRETIHRNYLSL